MRHRTLSAGLLAGTALAAVTMVGAANLSQGTKDEKAAPAASPSKSAEAGRGVVCFGFVDIDSKPSLIWPRDFPQPSFITDLPVKELDEVKKGQVLVTFDSEHSQLLVATAKAGIARAEAAVETQKAKLAEAIEAEKNKEDLYRAKEKAALARYAEASAAEKKYKEAQRLRPTNGTNDLDVDLSRIAFEGATHAYEAERLAVEALRRQATLFPALKIKEAEAGVKEAEAAVSAAKTKLAEAEYAIKIATVTSPVDGTIFRLNAVKGTMVGPQTREPLMWIQPKMPLMVRAEVEQEFATKVKVGMTAVASDDADPKLTVKGKVVKVWPGYAQKRSSSNPIDLQMSDQKVLEVLIELDNPDTVGLKTGQKMKVKLFE